MFARPTSSALLLACSIPPPPPSALSLFLFPLALTSSRTSQHYRHPAFPLGIYISTSLSLPCSPDESLGASPSNSVDHIALTLSFSVNSANDSFCRTRAVHATSGSSRAKIDGITRGCTNDPPIRSTSSGNYARAVLRVSPVRGMKSSTPHPRRPSDNVETPGKPTSRKDRFDRESLEPSQRSTMITLAVDRACAILHLGYATRSRYMRNARVFLLPPRHTAGRCTPPTIM